MTLPAFLRFVPVPVKSRHDGWSPQVQLDFVVALARGLPVDRAARAVGMSRATAYVLRKRQGSEGFAAAWDAALTHARRVRIAAAAAAPPPPQLRPSPMRGPATDADRRAFDALMAWYFPPPKGHKADEAAEADEADRR